MVKRPVFVDSALGQTSFTSPGQVKLRFANPLHQVARVRLRDAQIPRLDDITYVAVGLRCGKGPFIDNVQIPYSPDAVTTSGFFNVTGLNPGPALFAILPTAQANSVAAIEAGADVPYIYINQERYEFTFQPPINSMDELEIQLYRPPAPTSPSTLSPYDTRVFNLTLSTAPNQDYTGSVVGNKNATDQRSLPYFFTATVIAVKGVKLLLGSVSSTAAAAAYISYLATPGLLSGERTLYESTSGATIGTVAFLEASTTQTTLNLEFDCGR